MYFAENPRIICDKYENQKCVCSELMLQDSGTVSHHTIQNASKLRRKFVKLSAISDMKRQLVCAIKIWNHCRYDTIDFVPLLQKANGVIPIDTVVSDKGYDSERNHVESNSLGIINIIPSRNQNVPIYKTRGYHRKKLKRYGYDKTLYHQRNKTETIFSVIKKMSHQEKSLLKTENCIV